MRRLSLVGRRYALGDKEIAVQIRGNSHYRNRERSLKSECLSDRDA